MNYFEFVDLMNNSGQTKTEKTIADLIGLMQRYDTQVNKLIDIIGQQKEQIVALGDRLDTLAPEIEIIEMSAEDEAEQREMIARYTMYNPYWASDAQTYDIDDMINEMADASEDPDALEKLTDLFTEHGAGYLTRLYQKWKHIDHDKDTLRGLGLIQDTQKE